MTVLRLNGSTSLHTVDRGTFNSSDRHHQLWYSVVGFSGEHSTGLKQWQKCVYDVRAPTRIPSFVGDCQTTEDSLIVRWNVVPCTTTYLLNLARNGEGCTIAVACNIISKPRIAVGLLVCRSHRRAIPTATPLSSGNTTALITRQRGCAWHCYIGRLLSKGKMCFSTSRPRNTNEYFGTKLEGVITSVRSTNSPNLVKIGYKMAPPRGGEI